ncbi:redoxin domain-containing protein [Ornithinibacillus sp. L9]|uniref:Redoxin domain-containing protein n=2 Tax=Ornithinibacillus caprae TaxID=2678566 RepID=A0A6N8FLT8_9BACI|nr:SCO family protein [Ornithinibacillus caprae]MUK90121.1 redoxin domain-containing protein [Ornithinibacillus caprae]
MVAITIVLAFGVGLFFFGTDGFQAFTAETARTKKLLEEKPQFPNVTLEDSKERVYSFSEFDGKYVFITFIYTACTDVCPQLEMNMNEVYEQIPKEFIGEDIIFLSISFDPEQDDPKTLEKYRGFFGSDGETWRMARIPNQEELDSLLNEFGVIVIPEDDGNFTHNSAFYLVNPDGYLEEVMDYTKIDEAAETVRAILDGTEE